MKATYFILLLSCLGLGGCATLTKDECLTANWYELGQSDGASGRSIDYLAQHRKACAEYGVRVEPEIYSQGRNSGLQQYCRRSVGYHQGRKGAKYKGVCPKDLQVQFLIGYQQGREIYLIDQQIEQLKTAQKQRDYQQHTLKKALIDKETQLLASETSSERRRELYAEIDKLKSRIWRLKASPWHEKFQLVELQHKKSLLLRQAEY